jgi:hypothetical protein
VFIIKFIYLLIPYILITPSHVLQKLHSQIKVSNIVRGCVKNFRAESITKYRLTFGITRWEATQSVMAAKITRLTHKIAIQLHLMAESRKICSFRSRRPVRKLLDTPSDHNDKNSTYVGSFLRRVNIHMFSGLTTEDHLIFLKWESCVKRVYVGRHSECYGHAEPFDCYGEAQADAIETAKSDFSNNWH